MWARRASRSAWFGGVLPLDEVGVPYDIRHSSYPGMRSLAGVGVFRPAGRLVRRPRVGLKIYMRQLERFSYFLFDTKDPGGLVP